MPGSKRVADLSAGSPNAAPVVLISRACVGAVRRRNKGASTHACFAKAAESFRLPSQPVQITYEGTAFPGYLFNEDGSGERSPTVATIMGMDGYQEETYFGVVAAGLERGYNCLTYDGPSHGDVLRPRPTSWFGPHLGEVGSVARHLGVFADRGIVVENDRVGLLTSVPDDQRHASTTKLWEPWAFPPVEVEMIEAEKFTQPACELGR